jgi:hypothetical protein
MRVLVASFINDTPSTFKATANHALESVKFKSFGCVVISSMKKQSVGAINFSFSWFLAFMQPSNSCTMSTKYSLSFSRAAVL